MESQKGEWLLPRRPTTQRLTSVTAKEKQPLPEAGPLTTAQIEHRFAPHPQAAAASRDQQALSSGTRTLIATLILLALLSNLTVAAFVWLTAVHTYWSPPVAPAVKSAYPASTHVADDIQLKQVAKIPPVLTAPATLEAKASEDVWFPIAVDGTDGVPARSSIAINGLPVGATLSNGRPYGETGWNLKSDEIGDLHLVLPNSASGETKLGIQLIAPDGEVIANAGTILRVTIDPDAALVLSPSNSERKPKLTDTQTNEAPQELGSKDAEAKLEGPEAANAVSEDRGQSASNSPAQTANDDVNAKWIQPSTFVNLRERPSSSAPVISVVAKGAKLSVIAHKHRWVQVANPGTSESGWIYAGNVAGLAKSRRGPKRVSHPESQSDDSFWTSMGHWLTSP